MNVKSWLRRVPQPTTLRLDRKKVLRIGEGKTKWRDVLDAIELEQPSILEALDSDGAVIRITELAAAEEKSAEPGKDEKPQSELAQLGRMLLDAYRAGADQHAKAYELAFAENTKLVGVLADRLGGLETAWQQTLERRADELLTRGGGDGESLLDGPLAPLVSGFLAKQLQGDKSEKSASASTNGKKKGA